MTVYYFKNNEISVGFLNSLTIKDFAVFFYLVVVKYPKTFI